MAENIFTLMRSRKLSKSFKYQGMHNEFNQRHGYGKSIFPNGDEYEGFYSYGKRHGFGVYKYRNGAVYVGDFCNGKKVGLGRIIYPDGSSYDGKWKDDERHGFGIYRYYNGDVYEGNWKENQRHGTGKYTHLSAGMQYIGTWTKGYREVEGQLIDINSAIYMDDLRRIETDRENIRNQKREELANIRNAQGIEMEQSPYDLLTTYLNDITITYPGSEAVVEKEGRRLWWFENEPDAHYLDLLISGKS